MFMETTTYMIDMIQQSSRKNNQNEICGYICRYIDFHNNCVTICLFYVLLSLFLDQKVFKVYIFTEKTTKFVVTLCVLFPMATNNTVRRNLISALQTQNVKPRNCYVKTMFLV